MRIITLAGSARDGSHNQKLASAAGQTLADLGAEVVDIRLSDFPLPLMDVDMQNRDGIPEPAMQLGRQVAAADGLFIASPEYNSSIAPLLKNAIDWVSRISEIDGEAVKPWRGRVVALGAATPGKVGGLRALPHIRTVCLSVGCLVITEQIAIGFAARSFDDDGKLIDEGDRTRLAASCQQLLRFAGA